MIFGYTIFKFPKNRCNSLKITTHTRKKQQDLSQFNRSNIDVDYFKSYNDSLGHSAGDTVLQELSDLMQRATSRAGEVVARYGGEEFIIISPNSSPAAALRTASRLQSLVLDERIPHPNSEVSEYITISQGVVTVTPDGELQPGELINRADEALYEAKGAGRNTISVG